MNKQTPLSMERIEDIRLKAKSLFVDTQFIRTTNPMDHSTITTMLDSTVVAEVLGVLGDGGLMYLPTIENYIEIWSRFRLKENTTLISWLLQSSTTFKIVALNGESEYQTWIQHLSEAYGTHSQGTLNAIDDEYVDRLPTTVHIKEILQSNAWIVYLMSLHLSYHEILNTIISYYGLNYIQSLKEDG